MSQSLTLVLIICTILICSAKGFTEIQDFSKWALSVQAGAGDFEFPNVRGNGERRSPTPAAPSLKPEVSSFHIHSEIRYRYCRTNVISKVANPNTANSTEVTFQVVLPDTAFVSKFSMEIDGKVYEAYVKEKELAKQVYTEARERGQSAGLVEINARDSNVFNVNVNVKAKANITFNLTYEELLTRKLGRYEHAINVNSEEIAQIKDFKITVHIKESQNISLLRVPNLRNDLEHVQDDEGNNADVNIQRPTANSANISWSPSQRDQIRMNEQGIRGKFIVQYDLNRESGAGEILLMNGYFVHFFTPKDVLPLRKHVIFVLDVSGSMYGRKIEQLKSAMLFVLDDLKPDDYFNILTFSSGVTVWSPERSKGVPKYLRRVPLIANERNIRKAHHFVNRISPAGGTNINSALTEALLVCSAVKHGSPEIQEVPRVLSRRAVDQAPPRRRSHRNSTVYDEDDTPETKLPENVESTIIFLTDGQPTVGLTQPDSIIRSIQDANSMLSIPIFSLAFGDSADFDFVKKLSLQNKGFGRKIYEASDADLQLKGFYKEISSPLLSNISFQYTSDKYSVSKLTAKKFPNIFEGSEIAVAGRVKPKKVNNTDVEEIPTAPTDIENSFPTNLTNFEIPVLAVDVGANGRDGRVSYNEYDIVESQLSSRLPPRTFPDNLTRYTTAIVEQPKDIEDVFLERLWAYLTIRQLVDRSLAEDKSDYAVVDDDEESDEEENSDENNLPKIPEAPKPDEAPKTRALRLALKYGFVTSLTSLVVVKPNDTNDRPNGLDDSINLVQAQPSSTGMASSLISSSTIPSGIRAKSGPRAYSIGSGSSHSSMRGRAYRTGFGGSSAISASSSFDYPSASYSAAPGYTRMSSFPSENLGGGANHPQNSVQYTRKSEQLLGEADSFGSRPQSSHMSHHFNSENGRTSDEQYPRQRHRHRDRTNHNHTSGVTKTLFDLSWYHRDLAFVVVNGTRYTIDNNRRHFSNTVAPYECTIQSSVGNARSTGGLCKHLKDCILQEISSDINIYTGNYFCPLTGDYGSKFAGVCCPKFRTVVTL